LKEPHFEKEEFGMESFWTMENCVFIEVIDNRTIKGCKTFNKGM